MAVATSKTKKNNNLYYVEPTREFSSYYRSDLDQASFMTSHSHTSSRNATPTYLINALQWNRDISTENIPHHRESSKPNLNRFFCGNYKKVMFPTDNSTDTYKPRKKELSNIMTFEDRSTMTSVLRDVSCGEITRRFYVNTVCGSSTEIASKDFGSNTTILHCVDQKSSSTPFINVNNINPSRNVKRDCKKSTIGQENNKKRKVLYNEGITDRNIKKHAVTLVRSNSKSRLDSETTKTQTNLSVLISEQENKAPYDFRSISKLKEGAITQRIKDKTTSPIRTYEGIPYSHVNSSRYHRECRTPEYSKCKLIHGEENTWNTAYYQKLANTRRPRRVLSSDRNVTTKPSKRVSFNGK